MLCLTMALFTINISAGHRRPASSSRANRSQRTQRIPRKGNLVIVPVLLMGGCVLLNVLRPWPSLPMHDLVLPALRLLSAGIGLALVTTCLKLLYRPALIGRDGEKVVRQALARLGLPALHDVVLADVFGHTQIDHLVRTAQSIVVIETKTLAGWITGTLHGARWTQHLAAAARNDVRPDAQSRAVSGAHWLRLAGVSDAGCWRMGAQSVRRTRDHAGRRTVSETDGAGDAARRPLPMGWHEQPGSTLQPSS